MLNTTMVCCITGTRFLQKKVGIDLKESWTVIKSNQQFVMYRLIRDFRIFAKLGQ